MSNPITEGIANFFSPKQEAPKHWYTPVDNFQFVTAEFYQLIEKELVVRNVPGLEITRVEFSEGGMLSDKRQYLRLKREGLVFDICAAPFGTSYFFSFRFMELPLGIKPLELLIFLFGVGLVFALFVKIFGAVWGIIVFLGVLLGCVYTMRNAVALGLKDLDASLLRTPIIGPIYEKLFRKETYYRQDTRLMYQTTVNDITERLVEQVTAANGIKLLKQYESKPPSGDFYQPKNKRLDSADETLKSVA